MANQKTVCVIGANGFIGMSSLNVLCDRRYNVRATVRKLGMAPEDWRGRGFAIFQADVTDAESLAACVEGCDVVVNCAGIYRWWVPNTEDFVQVNDVGAGNVAEACVKAGVRRLVHFSTPMAYGYPEDRPFNEASQPGRHASEYARTKRLGDLRVKACCEGTSLEVVTLYLGCTIGEGDAMCAGRIAAVIRDFTLGKIPMLVGPDTNFIYVHIKDVKKALAAVLDAPREVVAGEDFFIANSAEMMTTRRFFDLLGKYTSRQPPQASLNLTLGYWMSYVLTWISTNITKSEPIAPVDIMRTAQYGSIEYTCQKSVDVLGLSYTPIEEAVAESVADVQRRMATAVNTSSRL